MTSFTFTGPPMASAPQYLKPYLDAVDGAMAVGGWLTDQGRQTHATWALFRGGEEVGRVTVEVPR